MTRAILDTDIFSEILRGRDPRVAARAASYLADEGRFTITCVTVLEVVSGWHRLRREDRVSEFLAALTTLEVLDFDDEAAIRAGRIEGDLVRTGTTIGRADTMIAGIALAHALPLVTGNTQHYARLGDLGYPLSLEDWRAAEAK